MRIIAGAFKSRILVAPTGTATRPTTDRAREALFNVLTHMLDFEGIRVLDLFAGSGALGFEAMSRGAASVVFVERDRKAITTIIENAHKLKTVDKMSIVRKDVYSALEDVGSGFDLVFADAPYDDERARSELLTTLFADDLLAQDGIAAIEHRTGTVLAQSERASIIRILEAGEAQFSLIRHHT